MNAIMAFSIHGSVEGIMKKAGGNGGKVSELLEIKRYAEIFGKVYVLSHDGKSYQHLMPKNCSHIRLRNRFFYLSFGWLVMAWLAWRKKVNLIKLIGPAALPLIMVAGGMKRPKVILKYYYLWHNTAKSPVKRFFIRKLERYLLGKVDYVIAANREVADFTGDKRKVLENIREGIITEAFDPARTNPDKFVGGLKGIKVVYVGRLEAVKDPLNMMKAYAMAKKRVPDMKLVVCGDGSLMEECRRLADGDVHFLGFVSDIPGILRASDIYVITSAYDASPRSLMEAMCMGLPCIATAVGGVPEYLAEGCGFLIKPKNPGMLAEKIIRLSKNGKLRSSMGKEARKRILKYHDLEKNLGLEINFVSRNLKW